MTTFRRDLFRCCICLVAVSLPCAPGLAQTVDEIIERHIEAIGGQATLAKVQDRVETWLVTPKDGPDISGPQEATFTLKTKRPNLILFVVEAFSRGEQQQARVGYDGKKWWHAYAGGERRGEEEERAEEGIGLLYALAGVVRLKDAGVRFRLDGKEEVDGHAAYVLKASPEEGGPITFYLDAESYVVRKVVAIIEEDTEQGMDRVEILPTSHRVVDGVRIPETSEMKMVAAPFDEEFEITLELKLREVAFNTGLERSEFSPPGAEPEDETAGEGVKKGWY